MNEQDFRIEILAIKLLGKVINSNNILNIILNLEEGELFK